MEMKMLCLIGFFALVGCSKAPDNGEIYYFKDSSTDLCFASYSHSVENNYVMTCVPCTEKVMQRILAQR